MSSRFDTIRHYFENDRFAASSGVQLMEVRPGFAKASLTNKP